MFLTETAEPYHPERVSNLFGKTAKKAGLPVIRLHDLRHSYATLALSACVYPKIISERLGHANIATTLDCYSHASPPAAAGPFPVLATIDQLTEQITGLDEASERRRRNATAGPGRSISRGIGTLTAQFFLLTIEDPTRLRRPRPVGSRVGLRLRPQQAESGSLPPDLRIIEASEVELRSLLVTAARNILGLFVLNVLPLPVPLRRFALARLLLVS